MLPKKQLGVIAVLASVFALVLPAQAQSAAAAMPAAACSAKPAIQVSRSLSSVKASQLKTLCVQASIHASKIHFWQSPKHRWTLYPHYPQVACWKLPESALRGPRGLCLQARTQVRVHAQKLTQVNRKIQQVYAPLAWRVDLAGTAGRRACVASVETYGSSHPYTQQQLGGGNYWGKYQYDPGTWQHAVHQASVYYHVNLPRTYKASEAASWEQEVVTAFAIAHPEVMGWDPWAECR